MSLATVANLDQIIERLFEHVLSAPSGYGYTRFKGKLFLPVAGKDEWRLMLRDLATGDQHPVFFNAEFMDKVQRALIAMQEQFDQAVPAKRIQ